LIEALKKKHMPDSGWHNVCEVAQIKRAYQDEIFDVFESHQSRVAICQCQNCKIDFLTSKSNSGRTDLSCIFGCRAKNKIQKGNRRSRAHYATEFGREQKKKLNRKRSEKPTSMEQPPPLPRGDRALLYYRWLIWVIENSRLSFKDLSVRLAPIFEKVRQHSLEIFIKFGDIPDS
jgi:hypothetical protein